MLKRPESALPGFKFEKQKKSCSWTGFFLLLRFVSAKTDILTLYHKIF